MPVFQRPVKPIEAIQFDGTNEAEIRTKLGFSMPMRYSHLIGYWVVKEGKGSSIYGPAAFARNFEPAGPSKPEEVHLFIEDGVMSPPHTSGNVLVTVFDYDAARLGKPDLEDDGRGNMCRKTVYGGIKLAMRDIQNTLEEIRGNETNRAVGISSDVPA